MAELLTTTKLNTHSQVLMLGLEEILIQFATQGGGGVRLALIQENWATITSDLAILADVKGHQLEFISRPVQGHPPHWPRFSVKETELVDQEVQKTPYETGGGGDASNGNTVPGPSYSSTEERSHIQTSVQSKAIQSFQSIPSYQDEGLEHSSRLVTTRDVDVQAGHEGCL